MDIKKYLDSTYLKTPQQAGLSDSETLKKVHELTDEAIKNNFFAVMIRPGYVHSVREKLDEHNSKVQLGTVIDFPEGNGSLSEKLSEAQKALADGADELDFVIDYNAFKKGNLEKVEEEVEDCSKLVLREGKIVKWIIETAALTDDEILGITKFIKDIVTENLGEFNPEHIFVKSSTGFYKTPNGEPNGANEHVIRLMLKNAGKLSVKASGGIRNYEDAVNMVNLGVKRLGTSSAMEIYEGSKKGK